jgi:hypothetical protein
MFYILFLIGVGFAAHFLALILVGTHAVKSTSFENFIRRLIFNIYVMVLVTFGVWFLHPQAVSLLIAFNMAFLISMLFVDFESTYDVIKREGISLK